MDKLQKKCLVATAIMHGLLLLVMVVGTAFFTSDKKPVDSPRIIEIQNFKLTDGASHGGGSPVAAPAPAPALAPAAEVKPQPQPTPPKPAPEVKPEPEPEPEPEPKREPVREVKPKTVEPKETVSELPVPKKTTKPTKVEHVSKPATKTTSRYQAVKRNIDISKPVTRDTRQKEIAAQRAAAAAEQRAAEQRARDLRSALNGAQKTIASNLSSATTFDSVGFGGGGQAEVNYGEYVLAKYDAAWIAPTDVDDNVAIVKARVVIARSGKVISSEIVRSSHNSTLDKSVRRALDSVSFVERFPEGSTDSQRTYIINFNLKSKRGIG